MGRSGARSTPARRKRVDHLAPAGGSSPRRMARTISTYSRISLAGASIDWPCHPSTTGRCDTPSPRFNRPCENSLMVAAVWAMVAGVRV